MNAPSRSPSAADAPPSAHAKFVHLKVHSAYSLLEGALHDPASSPSSPRRTSCRRWASPTPTICSARSSSPTSWRRRGIQPIVGVRSEGRFRESASTSATAAQPAAPRRAGDGADRAACRERGRLRQPDEARAAARIFEAAATDAAHTTIDALAAHADGLIALTGGPDGPIDRALRDGQQALAEARLKRLHAIFGDRLYVEIQRHGLKHEHDVEPQLLELAYALALPIVATNEVYFATPDDYEAHDALLCIADGALRRRGQSPPRHARALLQDGRRRWRESFADLPEALANTIEIAQPLRLPAQGPQADPAALRRRRRWRERDRAAALRDGRAARQAEAGLKQRLAAHPPAPGFTVADYEKRLDLRDRRHRAR